MAWLLLFLFDYTYNSLKESPMLRYGKAILATASAVLLLSGTVQAAPILVLGPSPVAPFAGTVIDFEGWAEGTLISNQYAGVTLSQDDGGTPQIDNSAFLFAYDSSSGTGVLTGSGGQTTVTTAGLVATFSSPKSMVGAFMSDTAPLSDYTVTAFGAGGVVLETLTILQSQFPDFGDARCDSSSPFETSGARCGVFAGFSRAAGDILAIQFGPSEAARGSDAFAIDDLRFAAVPEPASLALLGLGLAGLGWSRRKTLR